MSYPSLLLTALLIVFLPTALLGFTQHWPSFGVVFVIGAGTLGYLSYEVMAALSDDGTEGGPGYAIGLAMANFGAIVLMVAWFAFLLAAALKAYRIGVKRLGRSRER